MNYKSTKDLHEIEIKIRLTEKQAQMLEAIASYYDIPRAVVARKILHQGMTAQDFGRQITADYVPA